MPSCCSSIVRRGAVVAAALTFIVLPQAALAQPRLHPEIGLRKPQFVVTGVKIHAVHETGTNWPGNDEVEVLMSDFAQMNAVWFYNVDAGETFNIAAGKNCIQPQPACAGGVSNVHFRVALWENDTAPPPFANFCYGDLPPGDYWFAHGLCSGDDLIGRAEIAKSQDELVAALPTVGGSADFTIKPTGGDGNYRFTFRITRLPDVGRDIVIHEPPVVVEPPIALQASLESAAARRIKLNWTGATTTNVDIYLNGTIVTTAPNNGQYVTSIVQPGTYQCRVCNAGSATFCSANVSIAVP